MEKITKAIENLQFDAKIRAESSLSILEHVDDMLLEFKRRESTDQASILLDIFGLMQSLFVGIDALYQLSFSVTKYKYHININQNKNLRMLKYLRNDVVGHPTNRNYDDGSYGFSVILESEIKRDSLAYVTYIIKDKEITKDKEIIDFSKVLKAYTEEKVKLLNDLTAYLSRNEQKLSSYAYLVTLFEKGVKGEFLENDLDSLERLIMREQNLSKDSNNRFIWRLELLKKLYAWHDEKYQAYINYLKLKEILQLYKMTLDIAGKKAKMPKLKLPLILLEMNAMLLTNYSAQELIRHLNESSHPMFKYDLNHLIELVNQEDLKEFLNWFKEISDSNLSYIVGKSLKDLNN
ncbi:hypothetical protein JV173_03385 [Acholeplasma equirhinis]|uniref:hypothetical protein n=1 Tax=Acholeplasma equirhinis TaxID=555393 RepID=UPI00197A73B3|nr:hypothetical protein [Acholeplasma equirhinis]MBN3490552.1 hypothetical protein [Acholeplasma equirhinis]